MKDIWIFNHYALTPDMSGGTRHYDFARELVKRGYRVTIIASSFHYSQYKELKEYSEGDYLQETHEGVRFIWIKTRPYRGNGIGRVLNMLDYMFKAQKIVQRLEEKPDVIIGSSVHLFAVLAAYKVAKQFSVPFIMEVRDIWPQTLVDLGIPKWHPFIILLGVLEKFLYRKSDKIITNLPYAHEHILKYGVKKEDIVWISNGVDIERSQGIDPYTFEEGKIHITYAGAVGKANQLDEYLEAARLLQKETNVHFHVVGDGPMLSKFMHDKTDNVTLHGSVSKEIAIGMIKGSDILFFPLADSPIFNYGISSNKLFDYLASKKPILFASNAKNNPVKDANAGISIPAADAQAIIKGIKEFQIMGRLDREKLGANGYRYVSRHFTIPILVDKIEEVISSLVYNDLK